MDVINPVLTKLHRFSTHQTVRNIVGQANSTVNFRELLNERRILLVNTATGVIGPDAGGLLGAVLVDYINFAVREQMAIPDPSARARAVIVIDEFQAIPGVDYQGLLAELQKMGASFILATQALGQLDAIDRAMRPSILSNVSTLFVFQTSAEDADLLRHELDEAVTTTDIVNLDDYNCYVKTQLSHKRLPVMHVVTMPPPQGDRAAIAQITAQMVRYTRSIAVAESERTSFQEQWYGRERNLLRQLMMQGRTSSKKSDQDGKEAQDEKESKGAKEEKGGKVPEDKKDSQDGHKEMERPAGKKQKEEKGGQGTKDGKQKPDSPGSKDAIATTTPPPAAKPTTRALSDEASELPPATESTDDSSEDDEDDGKLITRA